MKKRLWLATILLVWGCSSSSNNDSDATTQDIQTDKLEQADVVEDQTAGEDAAKDGIPEDGTSDVQVDTLPFSDDFVQLLCKEEYCNQYLACEGEVAQPDCVATCQEMLKSDSELLHQLLCAHMTDGGDWCVTFDECPTNWEVTPGCVTMCDQIDGCNGLRGDVFGNNLDDCQTLCSFVATVEELAPVIDCVTAATEDCNAPLVSVCTGDGPVDFVEVCDGRICNLELAQQCGVIPGLYADVATCQDACGEWTPGQQVAADSCLDFGADLPIACAELTENCMGIPAELPGAALEYAKAVSEKCNIPSTMDAGELGTQLGAWTYLGMVNMIPELFVSFEDAMACLDTMAVCPMAQNAPLFCLLAVPEDGALACQTLRDVCTPELEAAELELNCRQGAAFAHVFATDLEAGYYGCIATAESCEEKQACFAADE